jgi:repressor LexA
MESVPKFEPLTTAQKETYDMLVSFIKREGRSPSMGEMMRALGLRSPAPVESRLNNLKKKGWINFA